MPRKPKLAETIEAAPVVTEEIIESVKGFSLGWTCRGYQFEISKSYERNGPVKACKSGFHAVSGNPLEVFSYYSPGTSRYAVVKQSGEIGRHSEDSKIASAKITIEAELKLPALIERAVKWLFANAEAKDVKHAEGYQSAASSTGYRSAASSTGDQSAASSTGDQSAASSTGDQSAASSTGDQSAASSTGYRSAASSTGYHSAASSTGDQSAASSTGYRSAASSTGYQSAASSTGYQSAASSTGDQSAASSTGDQSAASSTGYRSAASSTGDQSAASSTGYQSVAMSAGALGRVMGAEGCALFLVYRDPHTWEILHAWAGIAGRDGIKVETWYQLGADGKPVEAAQ